MIKDTSIEAFLDELASSAPTPGGGSVAAIMGAMGAALVAMVCNLTVGKKNHEAVSGAMTQALAEAEALRARLLELVEADVAAFGQVMAAYGLPKASDEQQQVRSAAIQVALKGATDVPLECARACSEVIRVCRAVAEQGNRNVISDAGVAVAAAQAALRSAALNVYVNTGVIRDAGFVASRLAELERLTADSGDETDAIYQIVRDRL